MVSNVTKLREMLAVIEDQEMIDTFEALVEELHDACESMTLPRMAYGESEEVYASVASARENCSDRLKEVLQ